ncbi:BZ3500_MvSof-1268-A1-R1_Chr5-2g07716 [Microbotryum saponariae]|uniref:BZ3500_MvSof-1268-A1-R1_Chr5-2g07716 protein n=1 Tax=Microbotryum saponariae TaxID=289078 RepID=A0A2X0KKG9_9BASI|nr:BZ3500_MvSof-1268-A1-R1_Chr5-2g07716 [Microbotryum saponariae]SDA05585.1 BZ3501_MvSof-1269-A2-R1_Chr5-2g07538 [Microbotryum saponariae]
MRQAQHADHLAPPPIAPVSTPKAGAGASEASHLSMLAQKVVLAGVSNMASLSQAASLVTNPFDLVKVRQQLQPDRTTTNWATTMRTMFKTEGPLSLYKGLSASMLREMTYSGLRMGAYDSCKAAVLVTLPWAEEGSFATKLTAGMTSGMLGAAVANPADLAS